MRTSTLALLALNERLGPGALAVPLNLGLAATLALAAAGPHLMPAVVLAFALLLDALYSERAPVTRCRRLLSTACLRYTAP